MKTKEIAFTLPLMLPLIEVIFFGFPSRKQWVRLIPFLLTLAIIPLSRSDVIESAEAGFGKGTTTISRPDYLFTQFRVVVTYLRLLLFPYHQNLDYDYPIYHSLLEPPVFFSFLFLLSLFTFSLYLLFIRLRPPHPSRLTPHSSRLMAFGILWFFLTLSIESSIIPIRDVIFEHRLYLPSVGLLLAESVLISALLERWKWMSAVVLSSLVVILSVATYERNLIWKDELTLWSDVVQKSPNKARGHNGLGVVYQNLERFDKAIQEYKTALTLNPDSASIHINLGNVYQSLGRTDDAIQEYKTALTLRPNFADAHSNLGNIYGVLGRLDEAIGEYKTALALNPDNAPAHINLGTVYKDLGRLEAAIREYQTALKLKPDFLQAHYGLGQAYERVGRTQEATREFEQALQIKSDYGPALQALKSLRQ